MYAGCTRPKRTLVFGGSPTTSLVQHKTEIYMASAALRFDKIWCFTEEIGLRCPRLLGAFETLSQYYGTQLGLNEHLIIQGA